MTSFVLFWFVPSYVLQVLPCNRIPQFLVWFEYVCFLIKQHTGTAAEALGNAIGAKAEIEASLPGGGFSRRQLGRSEGGAQAGFSRGSTHRRQFPEDGAAGAAIVASQGAAAVQGSIRPDSIGFTPS